MGLKFIGAKKLILLSIELILLLLIVSVVISLLANAFSVNDLQNVEGTISRLPVYVMVYLLIIRVLAEELFFRGFLVNLIGVVPSSIIFAAFHFSWNSVIEVIGAFVAGLILAYYFKKNQTIYPNIIAHVCYNLLVIFWMIR
ncbi:MAG: CPBP family intramembrane glutamic endopeptidase [archaeon]|nr:CPBP family intramembrane metalloprotease [Candidatus Micrarchaeota archaeon]